MKPADNIAFAQSILDKDVFMSIQDVYRHFLDMGGDRKWAVSRDSEFHINDHQFRVRQGYDVIERGKNEGRGYVSWSETPIQVCDEMLLYIEKCAKLFLSLSKSPRDTKIIEAISILYGIWDRLSPGEREVFLPIYLMSGMGSHSASQETRFALFSVRLPSVLDIVNMIGQLEHPFERLRKTLMSLVPSQISRIKLVTGEEEFNQTLKYHRFNIHRKAELLESDNPRGVIAKGCDPILAILFYDQEIEPYSTYAVETIGIQCISLSIMAKRKISRAEMDGWARAGIKDTETIERLVKAGIEPDPAYVSLPKSWENSFFGE